MKACSSRGCRRYQRQGLPRLRKCDDCVTDSQQQWWALYHLEYPSRAVSQEHQAASSARNELVPAEDHELHHVAVIPVEDTAPWDLASAGFLDFPADPTQQSSISQLQQGDQMQDAQNDEPGLPELRAAVHTLRTGMRLLEQRHSEPSEREQDLEMVLGNIWQALQRCKCPQTQVEIQPDTPLWKLVRRFCPNVLSNAPAVEPILPQQQNLLADWGFSDTIEPASLTWNSTSGMGSNRAGPAYPSSDSGYNSSNLPRE